jgi:glycosyltransferase involved in cell wall biosynthesis
MNLPGQGKKLTVCLHISGQDPQGALALLDTVLASPGAGKSWDLLVAFDAPSYDMRHLLTQEYQKDPRAVFFESRESLGKYHWWRAMLANVRSEYVLLLDQKVNPSPNWNVRILEYIKANPGVTLCGHQQDPLPGGLRASDSYRSPFKDGALLVKTSYYREIEFFPHSDAHLVGANASFFDLSLTTELGAIPDRLMPLDLPSLLLQPPPVSRDETIREDRPLLSICLCTYGHHPELILRCLQSVVTEPDLNHQVEVILGCNAVSDEVMREIDRLHRDGTIATIIRSPVNFNKAGMQRFTFRLARAPYILSLDDDMYFASGWLGHMKNCIRKSHPFEVAGRLHALSNRTLWSGQKKPYDAYCQKKRWWKGKRPYGLEVVFPAGQCFLARTRFLLDNDYPDLDMRIDWDDVLLGDLVTQLDGTQIWFPDEIMKLITIDDIPSRGSHGGG